MRLFVALELGADLKQRLSFLCGGLPGVRWTPLENLHLTLRFIGEVEPHRAEEIDTALGALRAPGFSLSLTGTGSFVKGGRTTLWAGVERDPALEHLQTKIETALQRAGLEPERRRFQPHVTLARFDAVPEQKLAAWMQTNNLFRSPPAPIRHFTLFSSRLGKEQPVYTPEVEYALVDKPG